MDNTVNRACLIIILLLLLPSLVFGTQKNSDSKILDLDSPVYNQIDQLYLDQGLASASGARPWSVAEARMILQRLNRASLNPTQQKVYDRLEVALEPNLKSWLVGVQLQLNPEYYYHSNSEDYCLSQHWAMDFVRRSPFFKGALELGIDNILYSYCDLSYGWGLVTYKDEIVSIQQAAEESGHDWVGVGSIIDPDQGSYLTSTRNWVYSQQSLFNFPDITMIEVSVPRRSVLSLGYRNINISFAHDRINWGTSSIGNFVLDDHVPYQNYIRLKGFSDKLSMDLIIMDMCTDPDTLYNSWGAEEKKYYLLHRSEFRPFSFLSFALSENVMYQVKNPSLEYFNLSYLTHQFNNSFLFNAIASAEVDVAIAKGLSMYGQFCLDQAQAPTESDAQADAYGWLAGLKVSKFGFVLNAEYAYASPCLYRRDKVDFLMYQKYNTNVTYSRPIVFFSIGFPYYGDSEAYQASLQYKGIDMLELSMYTRFVRQGSLDIYTSHRYDGNNNLFPNIKEETPYGSKYLETTLIGFRLDYSIEKLFKAIDIKVFAEFDFIRKQTVDKASLACMTNTRDTQISTGLSLSL